MPATPTSSNAFLAVFWGGLACGVFDITQAMYCVWPAVPFAPQPCIAVGCFRAARTQVVPRRREDCGVGSLPALSHRVYLGGDLLCGQSADFIPNAKAGDRRIVIRRVCLGDDELRRGAAFGHPSVASQNRSGFDHYRADLAHSPRRIADCVGGEPLGAKIKLPKMPRLPKSPKLKKLAAD